MGPIQTTQLPEVFSPSGKKGPEDILHSECGCLSSPGWEREEPLHTTVSFPSNISSWEGLEATLSLGYEWIPLLVYSKGTLMSGTDYVLGVISSAWPHLRSSATGLLNFLELGPEDTFHSRWGCDSPPSLGIDKLVAKANKTYFGIQIRQICTLPSSWSECTPDLVLQMSKPSSWDYNLGTTVMSSGCRIDVLVLQTPTSLSISVDSQWWGPVYSLQSPWCKIRVRAPSKWPHCWPCWLSSLGSLSHDRLRVYLKVDNLNITLKFVGYSKTIV